MHDRVDHLGLSPSFVFITGDIASVGADEDYQIARTFINRLQQDKRLNDATILMVPGNHDIDRSVVGPVLRSALESPWSSAGEIDEMIDSQDLGLLLRPFANYQRFVDDCIPTHPKASPHSHGYAQMFDIAGIRVGIIGLNSAWSYGDRDRETTVIGDRAVRMACQQIEGADLRIALVHHPLRMINDIDYSSTRLIARDFDFVLSGHAHRVNFAGDKIAGDRCRQVAGGAILPERSVPSLYNVGIVNVAARSYEVHLFRYFEDDGGHWAPDTGSYAHLGDGVLRDSLHARAITNGPPIGDGPRVAPRHSDSMFDLSKMMERVDSLHSEGRLLPAELIGEMASLLRTAFMLVIAAVIGHYQEAIENEQSPFEKKARSLKKYLRERGTRPALRVISKIAERCVDFVSEDSPAQLRIVTKTLCDAAPLGPLAKVYEAEWNLNPSKKGKFSIRSTERARRALLPDIAGAFSFLEGLGGKRQEELSDALSWSSTRAAMTALCDRLSTLSELTLIHTELAEYDLGEETFVARISEYSNGGLDRIEANVSSEESVLYSEGLTQVRLGSDGVNADTRIDPFLVIKDDALAVFHRSNAQGYVYRNTIDGRSWTQRTRQRFWSEVLSGDTAANPQSLFWAYVKPVDNQRGTVRANLPARQSFFLGRGTARARIRDEVILLPGSNAMIHGIGGIGKTATLLRVAWDLFDHDPDESPPFPNIIWVSAKNSFYDETKQEVARREEQVQSLNEVFAIALDFFGLESATEYSFGDKKDLFLQVIAETRTLLIVDNVESLEPPEVTRLLEFFDLEVKRYLGTDQDRLKIIVTSRRAYGSTFRNIQLAGLEESESVEFVTRLLTTNEQGQKSELTDGEKHRIAALAKGIPILLKHVVFRVLQGDSLVSIAAGMEHDESVLEFSFEEVIRHVSGAQPKLDIFLLLAASDRPMTPTDIVSCLRQSESDVVSTIEEFLELQCVSAISIGSTTKYWISDEARLIAAKVRTAPENAKRLTNVIERLRAFRIEAVEIDSTSAERAAVDLFHELIERRAYPEAERHLRESIQTNSESRYLRFFLGQYLVNTAGNLSAGVQLLEELLSEGVDTKHVLRLLFRCYSDPTIGRPSAALEIASRLRGMISAEDSDLLTDIGAYYAEQSSRVRRRCATAGNREKPAIIDEYKNLARNAVDLLSTLLERTAHGEYALARAYHNLWDYGRAMTHAENARRMAAPDSSVQSEAIQLSRVIVEQREKHNKNRDGDPIT